MAEKLGVSLRTYQSYERDETDIGAAALCRLLALGHNVNWILSGQGAEMLEAAPVLSTDRQLSEVDKGSQHGQREQLRLAIQLVSEVIANNRLTISPEKHAEIITLVLELIQEGLPQATVLRFASIAAA